MYENVMNSLRICGRIESTNDTCIAFHDGCCEAEPLCHYELMRKAADAIDRLELEVAAHQTEAGGNVMGKEYIEREAVLALKEPIGAYGMDISSEKVKLIPSADVRPVVTCADCKHNNACLTQAFVEDASRVPFDRNTFFCADGEKREES